MPRVKRGVAAKKRRDRILRQARGYYGARSRLLKTAREAVEKGWKYAYRDRKQRKRQFRALWITRINAAAREHGLSYSRPKAFGDLAELAKSKVA
jgi:large subunit ribosomal protein L20